MTSTYDNKRNVEYFSETTMRDLYYAIDNDRLMFSSELKSLTKLSKNIKN